jgi:hypothetical protein
MAVVMKSLPPASALLDPEDGGRMLLRITQQYNPDNSNLHCNGPNKVSTDSFVH